MNIFVRHSCGAVQSGHKASGHHNSRLQSPHSTLAIRHTNRTQKQVLRTAAGNSSVQSAPVVKSDSAGMQGQVDQVYLAAASYLKAIGFTNTAEIARVLDIATNPNSLFVQYNDAKRSVNANARPLTVQDDMQPVVEYFAQQGLAKQQIVQIITAHPPVLSYSVSERLQPFWEYLSSIGVEDVAAAVVKRPSLLGLDVDANLRKIVDYLQYVETPPEKIVQYITTTI